MIFLSEISAGHRPSREVIGRGAGTILHGLPDHLDLERTGVV